MLFKKRVWQIIEVSTPEELTEKLKKICPFKVKSGIKNNLKLHQI